MDYTDEIYACRNAGTRAWWNGTICACLKRLYNRELTEELGTLLRCGNESFNLFDLSLYMPRPTLATGSSRGNAMKLVYTLALNTPEFRFCVAQPDVQGGPAWQDLPLRLHCPDGGRKRIFPSPTNRHPPRWKPLNAKILPRPEEAAAAAARVRHYLTCDLMILDDSAPRWSRPFPQAPYITSLIPADQRKKTIISTNYGDDELHRKYTPQITSRLEGNISSCPYGP
jgi:DNA replication protein DnaC